MEVAGGVNVVTPEQVAEDLDAYVLVAPSVARDERPEVVLIDPGSSVPAVMRYAARIRFAGDVAVSIDGVRAWFRDRGRDALTWKLGPHTTPGDLEARLRAHGAHPDEAEPEHTAMVLEREPPGADGVEVQVVEIDASDPEVAAALSLASRSTGRAVISLPNKYQER